MTPKSCFAFVATLALSFTPGARAQDAGHPLDAAPSRFARLDAMRVHYKSLGEGETALVFVHGWTCDLTFWRAQVPAFAGKVRLVLLDLPGHGNSDRPKVEYTMELFARATDAVLRDAGVKQAVLAGHSMGTPVVRQFYRLYPEKTRGLVAVDGSLRRYAGTKEQLDQFVSQLAGPDGVKVREVMIDGMFTAKTSAAVRRHIKSGMLDTPAHVAAGAMRGINDPAVWKDDAIRVPVQAIMARLKWWEGDYEGYVRKLAPQVDYRVMDGVGHFLMMEAPDEFNRTLGEFLRKQGLLRE